ncbi:hypothetical protein F4859DRAFT_487962 [Xylaria cf. heliscus]|nr:hypothetical protein F4859DRAFT_487962 [Xylaria cf. heliscus]
MMASKATVSDENLGWQLEVFIAVFTPLEIACVALRFWARSLSVARYDLSDWLVLAALVGQIVAGGIAISSVQHAGVGQHAEYLAQTSPETIVAFFKYLVAFSSWYATTESLAKLAVCLLYKRIFPQQWIAHIVNVTIAVLIAASIAGLLADLFGCTPFSAHWGTPAEQAAHCINTEALFVWGSFPNIVTDVVMLIVPIPVLWNLNASTGLRVGLVVTFIFGNV